MPRTWPPRLDDERRMARLLNEIRGPAATRPGRARPRRVGGPVLRGGSRRPRRACRDGPVPAGPRPATTIRSDFQKREPPCLTRPCHLKPATRPAARAAPRRGDQGPDAGRPDRTHRPARRHAGSARLAGAGSCGRGRRRHRGRRLRPGLECRGRRGPSPPSLWGVTQRCPALGPPSLRPPRGPSTGPSSGRVHCSVRRHADEGLNDGASLSLKAVRGVVRQGGPELPGRCLGAVEHRVRRRHRHPLRHRQQVDHLRRLGSDLGRWCADAVR